MFFRICRTVRLVVYTVLHLRVRQVVYRVPGIRRVVQRSPENRVIGGAVSPPDVRFQQPPIPVTWEGLVAGITDHPRFRFLNIEARYTPGIWSDRTRGLLWLYHLHYLNWIHTPEIDSAAIREFLGQYRCHGIHVAAGREPYPTSLRIINMVKLAATSGATPDLTATVTEDVHRLYANLEYHLLGNHLLENGFALLWGGFFLRYRRAWLLGKRIILSQLREQILPDGMHYERSPMYHAIILWRVLDTINLLRGSNGDAGDSADGQIRILEQVFRHYAGRMLAWAQALPWSGEGEHRSGNVNDSAPGMTPTRQQLLYYGRRLGLDVAPGTLGASGYRVLTRPGSLKLLADVGAVGPDYQPGHAHADTLAFELYHGDTPILIDTGTSTYEGGSRRAWERSTRAHNTVSIGRFDSSEVWSTFRVARRARVTIREDQKQRLVASHDGYRNRFGITHTRSYDTSGSTVVITDTLSGRGAKLLSGTATFIVAPELTVERTADAGYSLGPVTLEFFGAGSIRTEQAEVATGFNTRVPTTVIRVRFNRKMATTIRMSRWTGTATDSIIEKYVVS